MNTNPLQVQVLFVMGMAVGCQVHKKSYRNGELVYEVRSKFGDLPYLKTMGADTARFGVGTKSCPFESRSSSDTMGSETCLSSKLTALLPSTSVLGTGQFAIESRPSGLTVSSETCLSSELMALIPSSFVQVRDHVTIESHCSECETSF
jgi:hypothetical protein